MAIAFDVSETRPFILEEDLQLPPEQQTTFHLGVLDTRLATNLKDSVVGFEMNDKGQDAKADISFNSNTWNLEVVRFGLKGWENFRDKRGELIPFDVKTHMISVGLKKCGPRIGLTDKALDLLKPYIAKLAKQIERDNWLDEDEVKN